MRDGRAWEGVVDIPVNGRTRKPRQAGITMVIDKGLGLQETADWLALAGDVIDFLKLGFGTSVFYSRELLQRKVEICRQQAVSVYPGGTLAEVALLQGRFPSYLRYAYSLGIEAIEISDGTITLSPAQRRAAIKAAQSEGFTVITEVGKKALDEQLPIEDLWDQALLDLDAGASFVIVEARESGKGVGIYDAHGDLLEKALPFLEAVGSQERVIWEAPLKSQQEALIRLLGPNVSLGNISPGEVLALEALRVGLRADTLRVLLMQEEHPANETANGTVNGKLVSS